MAYDSIRQRTVLFGGAWTGAPGGMGKDTWEWDGTNWTQRSFSVSPSGRTYAAMAFDAERGVMVLFGGGTPTQIVGDTWTYDGIRWTQKTVTSAPASREETAMAFDGTQRRMLLFGGFNCIPPAPCTSQFFNDTWAWDGTSWSQLAPAAPPSARMRQTLAFDENRSTLVLFGGEDASLVVRPETWELESRHVCAQTTCAAQTKNCGTISDGCGGALDCGSCTAPQTCGGGGTANVCGCSPTTCAVQAKNCGTIADGCGGTLTCGSCTAPQTCGGGGTANVCGNGTCTPKTCTQLGKNCGQVSDGCGGLLNCGTCTAPQTCGGGGTTSVCGCTPDVCGSLDCGSKPDNCGGTLNCGSCSSAATCSPDCTPPQTCGGGGTPGVCGCTPTTCATLGRNCGTAADGCGGTLNCGSCTPTQICGGDGTPGVCGCSPTTCAAAGKNCGSFSDGCGGTLDCGTCSSANEICGGAGSPNVCGCQRMTCPAAGSHCQQGPNFPDGCGGMLDCTAVCDRSATSTTFFNIADILPNNFFKLPACPSPVTVARWSKPRTPWWNQFRALPGAEISTESPFGMGPTSLSLQESVVRWPNLAPIFLGAQGDTHDAIGYQANSAQQLACVDPYQGVRRDEVGTSHGYVSAVIANLYNGPFRDFSLFATGYDFQRGWKYVPSTNQLPYANAQAQKFKDVRLPGAGTIPTNPSRVNRLGYSTVQNYSLLSYYNVLGQAEWLGLYAPDRLPFCNYQRSWTSGGATVVCPEAPLPEASALGGTAPPNPWFYPPARLETWLPGNLTNFRDYSKPNPFYPRRAKFYSRNGCSPFSEIWTTDPDPYVNKTNGIHSTAMLGDREESTAFGVLAAPGFTPNNADFRMLRMTSTPAGSPSGTGLIPAAVPYTFNGQSRVWTGYADYLNTLLSRFRVEVVYASMPPCNAGCPSGTTCNTSIGRCAVACSTSAACTGGSECTTEGFCAKPTLAWQTWMATAAKEVAYAMKCGIPVSATDSGGAVLAFILRLINAKMEDLNLTVDNWAPGILFNIQLFESTVSAQTEQMLATMPRFNPTGSSRFVFTNYQSAAFNQIWQNIADGLRQIPGDGPPTMTSVDTGLPLDYILPGDMRPDPYDAYSGPDFSCAEVTLTDLQNAHFSLAGKWLYQGHL